MSSSPCHWFGRLLTAFALLGYLAATAEQIVPDCHDRDGVIAVVSTLAAGGYSNQQSDHSPAHPFHLCHEGHQHLLVLSGTTPLPLAQPPTASIPDPTLDSPRLPPIGVPLRPPVV